MLFPLVGGLVASLIKLWIYRLRPQSEYARILIENGSASYPSSTVVMVILFFGFNIFLTCYLSRMSFLTKSTVWLVGIFMILTVPIARIYVGAHWFTDVVGGAVLGLLLLLPVCFFYHKCRAIKPCK
ncbi:phosphatase PAP2 family protein [Mucilaginibacter defluvii]|uniref:phosphatase PAP2 family protein n=1 Tax=Mucilaginibacter defluvii TaxID=1196019 RepID=UPI0031E55BC1